MNISDISMHIILRHQMQFEIQLDDLQAFSSSSGSILRQLIKGLPELTGDSLGVYLQAGIDVDRLGFAVEMCYLKADGKQIQQLNREINDFVQKKLLGHPPGEDINMRQIYQDGSICNEEYDKPQTGNFYQQIRELFKTSGIIGIINTFGVDNNLKCVDIKEMLNNLGLDKQIKRQWFIQYILNGNHSITFQEFYHKIKIYPQVHQSPKIPPQPEQIDTVGKYFLSEEDKTDPNIKQIINCLKSKQIQIYTDKETPQYKNARTQIHLAKENIQYCLFSKAEQQFQDSDRNCLKHFLSPKDIVQGNVGSCYFLSAIISMTVKHTQLLYQRFIVYKNPAHIYGVKLFIDGKWQTTLLDTCFPLNNAQNYCGVRWKNKKVWPLLLEKAFAKIMGSYNNIAYGKEQQGVRMLTGAPSIHLIINKDWMMKQLLQNMIERRWILTCASITSKSTLEQVGLIPQHSYSILNVISAKMEDSTQITLIQLRNPWGQNKYKHKLGLKSEQLTKHFLKKKYSQYFDSRNGTFWMHKSEFFYYFYSINICRIEQQNKNSFLDLNLKNRQFTAINIRIDESGIYAFTIYLQNQRQIRKDLSIVRFSWMFLFKKQGGKLKGICNSFFKKDNNTLQLQDKELERGEYMLALRVCSSHQTQKYCLTSYGPESVDMKLETTQFNNKWLSDYMDKDNKSFQNQQKIGIRLSEHQNIKKKVIYYHNFGYAVMQIINEQKQDKKIKIIITKRKGVYIQAWPPNNHSIIELKSQSIQIIRFLVSNNIHSSDIGLICQ